MESIDDNKKAFISISRRKKVFVYVPLTLLAMYLFITLQKQSMNVPNITVMPAMQKITNPSTATENCLPELEGMKVLALHTHLYGNLGDEMETTPFLQKLKRCGVLTTGLVRALPSATSSREHGLLEDIITLDDEKLLNPHNYHAVIHAPGPYFSKWLVWNHTIDIYFSVSFMTPGLEWAKSISQNYKPSLVIARETKSERNFEENVMKKFNFNTTLAMSGDLSHSYVPSEAALRFWDREWEKRQLTGKKIVFVRSKFRDTMEISKEDRTIRLKTLDKGNVVLNAEDVILATSAAVEEEGDIAFFEELEKTYGDLLQLQFLTQIEEMWALIRNSYSRLFFSNLTNECKNIDHPGCAAHRLGIPLTVLWSKWENKKMEGLKEMEASKTTDEIRELNAKALQLLQEELVRLKKKNHAHVLESSK